MVFGMPVLYDFTSYKRNMSSVKRNIDIPVLMEKSSNTCAASKRQLKDEKKRKTKKKPIRENDSTAISNNKKQFLFSIVLLAIEC